MHYDFKSRWWYVLLFLQENQRQQLSPGWFDKDVTLHDPWRKVERFETSENFVNYLYYASNYM